MARKEREMATKVTETAGSNIALTHLAMAWKNLFALRAVVVLGPAAILLAGIHVDSVR